MPSYEKDVRKILLEEGCAFHRQGKGDHEIWFSPICKLLALSALAYVRRQSGRKTAD